MQDEDTAVSMSATETEDNLETADDYDEPPNEEISARVRLPGGIWQLCLVTLRAELSGAVYYQSCLFVCGCVCLWVCYHNNSKLRASIFTKLGL